jgi:hypothetical protein
MIIRIQLDLVIHRLGPALRINAMAGAASPVCRGCGCTEWQACKGGCYWVESDLCSRCAGKKGVNSTAKPNLRDIGAPNKRSRRARNQRWRRWLIKSMKG